MFEFQLILPNLPISTKIVWEYLLNDKENSWRVVRLKSSDLTMPRQYMIVSEETKVYIFSRQMLKNEVRIFVRYFAIFYALEIFYAQSMHFFFYQCSNQII